MAATDITTYLWFDEQSLGVAEFYVGLFPGAKLGNISHYQADAQKPEGSVLTVEFELFGRPFVALNGGPHFSQEDVDRIWDAIVSNGGAESQCGWCKDRFGVSWQIIPVALGRALQGLDGYDSKYAFEAMMKMSKIIVADLAPA